jgi:hypothetical protein
MCPATNPTPPTTPLPRRTAARLATSFERICWIRSPRVAVLARPQPRARRFRGARCCVRWQSCRSGSQDSSAPLPACLHHAGPPLNPSLSSWICCIGARFSSNFFIAFPCIKCKSVALVSPSMADSCAWLMSGRRGSSGGNGPLYESLGCGSIYNTKAFLSRPCIGSQMRWFLWNRVRCW